MKSIFSICLCAFMMLSFNANANYKKAEPCTVRIKMCYVITGKIGRASEGCRQFGVSCLKLTACDRVSGTSLDGAVEGTVKLLFEMRSSSELAITFLGNGSTSDQMLVEQNSDLAANACKDLGYSFIQLQKGKYSVTKNADGSFTTVIKVTSK